MFSKVFLSNNDKNYALWLPGVTIVNNIEDADFVIFEGGIDVNPEIYGAKKHPKTDMGAYRDTIDLKNYEIARNLNKPLVGICRGAQFLCAKSGGKLIQDQFSGPSVHKISVVVNHDLIESNNKERKIEEMETTSSHHQAMYVDNMDPKDYIVLGWTKGIVTNRHLEDHTQIVFPERDMEIVYFRKTNSLCIQGHPEWIQGDRESEKLLNFKTYCQSLIFRHVHDTLDTLPF